MNALGKYVNTNSFLHQLDPRTKMIAMMMLLTAILLPSNIITYVLLIVVVLTGLFTTKMMIPTLKSISKSLIFMGLILLIFNIFIIKTDIVLFEVLELQVHLGALTQTLFVIVRLYMLLSVSMILTLTTKPLDLAVGLEQMMHPLKKWNVPVSEIAMIISIALRFIPVFASEAQKIKKAQTSRGVDFDNGTFKEKVTGILSLIVPLFVSAFQKANDLADAMEVRGYATHKPRTKYRVLKYQQKDYLFLTILVLGLIFIFGISYAL